VRAGGRPLVPPRQDAGSRRLPELHAADLRRRDGDLRQRSDRRPAAAGRHPQVAGAVPDATAVISNPSFPSSAWERPVAKLCFAPGHRPATAVSEAELRKPTFPSRAWERGESAMPIPDPLLTTTCDIYRPFGAAAPVATNVP